MDNELGPPIRICYEIDPEKRTGRSARYVQEGEGVDMSAGILLIVAMAVWTGLQLKRLISAKRQCRDAEAAYREAEQDYWIESETGGPAIGLPAWMTREQR